MDVDQAAAAAFRANSGPRVTRVVNPNDFPSRDSLRAGLEEIARTTDETPQAAPQQKQAPQDKQKTPVTQKKAKKQVLNVAGTQVTADTMIRLWPLLSPDGNIRHAKATPIYVRAGDLCGGNLSKLQSVMEKIDDPRSMDVQLLRKGNTWEMAQKLRLTDRTSKESTVVSYSETEAKGSVVDMDLFRMSPMRTPDGTVVGYEFTRTGFGALSFGPTAAPRPAPTQAPARSSGLFGSWFRSSGSR